MSMKKMVSLVLSVALLFSSFPAAFGESVAYRGLNDPALHTHISDELYTNLITSLDSDDYAVTDIQTVYISQEYLDELAFNSQTNVFFGYSLEDLDARFEGTRYVFVPDDYGQTAVEPFESCEEDVYNQVIQNVAMGTGVILVCVTVSAVAYTGAPAVSMIFAVAAKTGTTCALSGGVLGAVSAGIVTGLQTNDMDQALEAAMVSGSEGFKWGAITGALKGATTEGVGLYRATLGTSSTLTMNDVAVIQRTSKLPLSFIKYMHSMDEFNLYQEYGLQALNLDGTLVYGQTVDFSLIDEYGRTNVQRIQSGLAPIDSKGIPFELHHIGQSPDSPLAILTKEQHRGAGHFKTLHFNTGDSESTIAREAFEAEKDVVWGEFLRVVGGM